MHDAGDMELLREYDRQGSEAAFAALVQRHISLVYSAALRHAGIAAHAEEITQAVFIILARKAAALRPDTVLESWLYETARLTALSFRRGERRRQFREQEAYMQSTLQETAGDSTWNRLAPLLDEAMARLGKKDRDAVVLRFFKDKNLREVAAALKVNETAAQRRVHRAVEKLRKFFTRRGIILPAAVLTAAISANSVQAAPVALAKSVTAVAITKGAAASTSTLTLIKGALKVMAWTKTQAVIVSGIVAIVAVSTTTVIVKQAMQTRINDSVVDDSLFNPTSQEKLFAAPGNIVILRPTHFSQDAGAWTFSRSTSGGKTIYRLMEREQTIEQILSRIYETFPSRLVLPADLPQGDFDYLTTLPNYQDQLNALQAEIKKKLGLIGHREMRETDVLLLKVKNPDVTGLKPHLRGKSSGVTIKDGKIYAIGQSMGLLETYLENSLKQPVFDRTLFTNRFDYVLDEHLFDGTADPDLIKNFMLDELGLELVPTNMPFEMVVVEKAQ